MKTHRQFQILSAWAPSGQLSAPELRALEEHARQCPECRERMAEFAQMSAQALLPLGSIAKRHALPRGMEARFTARALAEGIPLVHSASARPLHWLNLLGASAAALLLIALLAGGLAKRSRSLQPRPSAASRVRAAEGVGRQVIQVSKSESRSNPVRTPAGIWRARTRKPRFRLAENSGAAGVLHAPASIDMNAATTMGNGIRAATYLSALTRTDAFTREAALKPSLAASLQDSALVLPALFEADTVSRMPRIFPYQPSVDGSPRQPVYRLQNVDWHRYWMQQNK